VRAAAKRLGIPIGLFAVSLLLYAPVLYHSFVNYDDPDYVTSNFHVRAGLTWGGFRWAFTSTWGANWFPLTWISHMTDVALFGLDNGRHHLTSVVLHSLSAVLLYLAFLRMTADRWRSVFVAAVFAVHPLHVESVAWIAERKDVLCGFFWMLTILAYIHYVETRSIARYLLVVAVFAAALMAKPMAVTLPVVLLLLDIWPLRRGPVWIEKLPLFALSVGASVIAFLAQSGSGAVLSVDQLPLAARLANAIFSYAVYAGKLIWPSNLAVFYPFRAPALWETVVAAVALAAITALAFCRRELLVGWLWFLATLLPVIGLVQIGMQARADRYTYLPSIGLAILLAWGLPRRREVAVAGILLCVAWAVAAEVYLGAWRNSRTLFAHALEVTGGNYVAHNNLGVALQEDGEYEAATRQFQAALAIRPLYADAQGNLGESLLRAGRIDEAAPHIDAALRLRPDSPVWHVNLGALLGRRGQLEGAEAEYRRALELDSANAEARAGLGAILTDAGKPDEALPHLQEALRLRPDYADAHYNLGRLYGATNRPADAEREFREVLRLRPADAEARFNLGTALAAQDRIGDAIDEFRATLRLEPGYANAHFNLAVAYATRNDFGAAIPEFEQTLRLRPDLAEARRNLEMCRELLRAR
jgi:tetratricopeptide (TPR) repeat protein